MCLIISVVFINSKSCTSYTKVFFAIKGHHRREEAEYQKGYFLEMKKIPQKVYEVKKPPSHFSQGVSQSFLSMYSNVCNPFQAERGGRPFEVIQGCYNSPGELLQFRRVGLVARKQSFCVPSLF